MFLLVTAVVAGIFGSAIATSEPHIDLDEQCRHPPSISESREQCLLEHMPEKFANALREIARCHGVETTYQAWINICERFAGGESEETLLQLIASCNRVPPVTEEDGMNIVKAYSDCEEA
uniref:Uncharacterized protein n=1 Tax=Pandinus cavimanus TaxID=217261 RepID=H2CYQ4_PANCV|nr:hypothetical protein [Pandinus cavimanus]